MALSVPPDLVALPVLGVAAIGLAKRIEVGLKPDWIVPSNLWLIQAFPSGGRKTAALALATEPLLAWEQQDVNRRTPILDRAAQRARRRAARGAPDRSTRQTRASMAPEETSNVPPAPAQRFTSDATAAALVQQLAAHGGRFALITSDPRTLIAAWRAHGIGRSRESARLLTECYGDPAVVRVPTPTRYGSVTRPALTILMTAPEGILAALLRRDPAMAHGLIGRVLWSLPRPTMGDRTATTPPISDPWRAAYRALVFAMLAIPPAAPERPERTLSFTPAARRAFLAFAQDMEQRQRPAGDLAGITAWASRAAEPAARIAGLMHSVQRIAAGDCPGAAPIDEESVERAITIMTSFIPHARAAHDLMAGARGDPRVERRVAWVMRHPSDTFTDREAVRALRRTFRTIDALHPALALLEQHHDLASVLPPANGRGRPARISRINRNPAHERLE